MVTTTCVSSSEDGAASLKTASAHADTVERYGDRGSSGGPAGVPLQVSEVYGERAFGYVLDRSGRQESARATRCLTPAMSMSIFGPAVSSRAEVFSPYTRLFAGGQIALTLEKCQGYVGPLGPHHEVRARLHGVTASPIERRTDAGLDRPIGSSGTPESAPACLKKFDVR